MNTMTSNNKETQRGLDKLTADMRPQDAAFMRRQFGRRSFLKGAAGAGAGLAAAGMFGASAFAAPGSLINAMMERAQTPMPLPEGAAPAEEQVWRITSDPAFAKSLDFYETVYNRAAGADLNSEGLVRMNRNFEIIPATAESWSGSEDGKTWTFKLVKTLTWSDGNPVTAADFIKTFQYAADPDHAWDFAWFWSGNIVNFQEAFEGKVPVEEIGVKQGADEYELIFTTVEAAPYLPAKLIYSMPLSKAALEKSGPFYNSKPETAVSSGPFILEGWIPDQQVTLKRNEKYTGTMNVPIQKVIGKLAASSTAFTMYEAGEIDQMEGMAPAELKLVNDDPDMKKELYQGVSDFACYYFFFDTTIAPWDDIKVRQAFSHIVDRDAMKQQIWDTQANPAPSFLAQGFPASNVDALKDIQKFDPDLAKQLLAEAGFPDGKGFPAVTITQRGGAAPLEVATIQAYAAMIKQHLNIDAQVQNLDRQAFYADMKKIPLGFVSYGMDYFDASNMLGVWLSGGRHAWSNKDYDAKVNEATTFLGDEAERTAMFQEAEKILVSDVPAAFTFFITPNQLVKSYVAGPALEPDKNGIAAIHWPGYATMSTVPEEIWIADSAPKGRS
ncbi:MAG: peptide ABC transporter substrate-binding protein [Thermomicrobiales bacterium]